MTPSQFKEARMLARLTAEAAGKVCHLQGKHRGRSVRKWESGQHPIPLYAEVAIRAYAQYVVDLSIPALLRKQAA